MNRYKKTLVVLVIFSLLLGCSMAFGRAGLGNSFMRAFGMTPSGPPAPPAPPADGTSYDLTTALWTTGTISTQQILPTFTPYTYGYGAARF